MAAGDGAGKVAGEGERAGTRLSTLIGRRIFLASALLILACGVALAMCLYGALGQNVEGELVNETSSLAQTLDRYIEQESQNQAGQVARDVLCNQNIVVAPDTRITLIDPDGSVVYDNSADPTMLDNHSMRPEFVEASTSGAGSSGRYSTTLHEETLYHAMRLSDGSVIRLAKVQSSAIGMLLSSLPPVIAIVALGIAVSYFVGRRTAKRVSNEIMSLDLDHPDRNADAPEELVPLLDRLLDQKRKLDAQDAERRRFTSNASHELKTPLTVISGYAELIAGGIAKPEDVDRFSGIIYDESKRMKAIVDDLLVLNRLDDIGDEPTTLDLSQSVSLDDVAASAVDRVMSIAAGKNVRISLDVPRQQGASEVCVKGNLQMLEELARNIVENAVRYNVEGGSVEVSAYRDGSGRGVLRVADTGIGIPPELREKVFERFYCVDESRSRETGGSGLGLAIVKHTAQLHGAQVVVSANEPHGTVFEVIFPA